MEKLGEIIKKYRQENSLSLREFSKRCNLSHAYIDKLEKGIDSRSGKVVEPTLDALEKVSNALGLNLNELLIAIGKIENTNKNQSKEIKYIENTINKLNDIGKKEAIKRINELTEINKYTTPVTIAAHNDYTDKEQIKLMEEDLDEL